MKEGGEEGSTLVQEGGGDFTEGTIAVGKEKLVLQGCRLVVEFDVLPRLDYSASYSSSRSIPGNIPR